MDHKLGIDNASTTYKAHNFATGEWAYVNSSMHQHLCAISQTC